MRPNRLTYLDSIDERGFAVVSGVLDAAAVERLVRAIEEAAPAGFAREDAVFAVRNLAEAVPEVSEILETIAIRRLVEPILGEGAFAVRATLLDKLPGANWHVGWHQDRIIPVAARRDAPGFCGWSVKAGVVHCKPPAEIQERMLAVRLHLDDCPRENGALVVMPGTHHQGELTGEEIDAILANELPEPCAVARGGVVVMRPLLLHASFSSSTPMHRRVIHVDFAADALPWGIEWNRVQSAAAQLL